MVIRRKGSWPLLVAVGMAVVLGGGGLARAEVSYQPECQYHPFRKLMRGVANTVFGVFEIPLTIQEVGTAEGPAAGMTMGLLSGLGAAVTRIGVGIVEVVTFPLPLPRIGYEPILQPEFLFQPGNPH